MSVRGCSRHAEGFPGLYQGHGREITLLDELCRFWILVG
jgi:hypothetical protein